MKKDILVKTARLARLKLTLEEEEEFTHQLKAVFQYFNQISSVETKGVAPLVYPLEGKDSSSALRADRAYLSKNQKELLDLAPEKQGTEYKVPPVVD